MTTTQRIVGIGNAVVDIQDHCTEQFLVDNQIEKGAMQLVEAERSAALYSQISSPNPTAGGSVANTIAGVGALGGQAGFIGRVSDDELGRAYDKALRRIGIDFPNPPVSGDTLPTSRSMIFVTPDGERSMNTYLGISALLGPQDIPQGYLGQGEILFIEGYLYDKAPGKEAIHIAAKQSRQGFGMAGVSLSDSFCVERHRDDFLSLIKELDFVIGNQHEWMALFEASDLDKAVVQAQELCRHIVVTQSSGPVRIVENGVETLVPVERLDPVDTTGAGDQFAAGYLFGVALGRDAAARGRMGVIAAQEVIMHLGAHPQRDLVKLMQVSGLI
ncbi:MAG: adenosine kinase [Paracoccaceae bacterium]